MYYKMEDLELIFGYIRVSDIEGIFNWMSFNKKNIESSHFFINGEDKEYQDISSFSDYFKNQGTCNILIKELDLGVVVKKSIIVISFDEVYGDLTLNFSEDDWGTDEKTSDEKVRLLSEKLDLVKQNIHYTSILFGYEPAEDEDMQLINLKN